MLSDAAWKFKNLINGNLAVSYYYKSFRHLRLMVLKKKQSAA